MTRQITVRDFAQLTKELPAQLEAAAIRGLRSAAARGVGEVVRQIDHAEPYSAVDTGALRQSARSEPIPEGAELSVDAPQAAWIEFGTRPHMPPFGPILTWVTRKFFGGAGRRGGGKKRARKQGPKLPPKQGPKAPPKHGPRLSREMRGARKAARAFAKASHEADQMAKAHAMAKRIQWKIFHHGTAPRGFFAKAMKVVVTKYCPQEIRRELKALEKRL